MGTDPCCDGHNTGPSVGAWRRPRRPRTSSSTQRRRARPEWGDLVRAYYRHVAPEDLAERSPEDLLGAVSSHRDLASSRPQGTAAVRVVTPTIADAGWSASGRSVVEVVTDDMPFLVDSVTMELNRLGHNVHAVIHPQLTVERDITGALQDVHAHEPQAGGRAVEAETRPAAQEGAESWMHVEIDRTDDDEAAEITEGLQRVLRDVRESVEDWEKMHAQVAGRGRRARAGPAAARRARSCARAATSSPGWPTTTSRSSATASTASRRRRAPTSAACAPSPAPASASCAPTRTCRPRSPSCRRWSRRRPARRRCWCWPRPTRAPRCTARPTSTTSASRRSAPTARSSGSAASSACSPAPPTPSRSPASRCCARRSPRSCASAGFDPRSHAGKALMDTLENYPRDELFHTPPDELAPIAQDVMFARERRQLRALRAPRHLRPLRLGPGLPAARPLQHRGPRAVLRHPARPARRRARRVHRAGQRVDDRAGALRGPPAQGRARSPRSTSPTSSAGWPRPRGRGATTSWPPSVSEYGEDEGSRLARAWARRVPRGLQGGLPARSAGRPTSAASRPSRARRASTSRSSTRTSSAALPPRRGAAQGLPRRRAAVAERVLPMLSSMGVEVVDERPYELAGLAPALLHLRVRPALTAARSPPHARDALRRRAARGVGRLQRDRRLQRARARRRADVAAGHGAARLREVHASRATRPSPSTTSRRRCAATSTSPGCWSTCSRRASTPVAATGRSSRRRGAGGQGRGDRGAARQGARRRGQPRPRPHPALLPAPLIRATLRTNFFQRTRRRAACTPTSRSSSSRRRSPTCPSRARASRSSSTPRASRARTCASARSRAVACAGPTAATTSAPRCSAWSRRRW